MYINKFGQVTNNSDLLLTSTQEEFMKSLLDDGKATSLSLRYGKAVANRTLLPSIIYDLEFETLEDAFTFLDQLETSFSDIDDYDLAYLDALHYYFPI